jgi:hypothetical protein
MIRRASPKAIALLYQMVQQGEAADLRTGLAEIFATPEAQGAIGKYARAMAAVPYLWSTDVELRADIARITQAREDALEDERFREVIAEFAADEDAGPGPG